MTERSISVLFVVVMIVLIVGVDIIFFRDHVLARLLANVGIVLLFAAFYLRFVKHS